MKYRGKAHFLSYWFEAKRKWKLGWFCGGLGLETIIKKKMLPFFCILLVFLLHVKFEFIQLNLDKFV